jgi:hypothetical protein
MQRSLLIQLVCEFCLAAELDLVISPHFDSNINTILLHCPGTCTCRLTRFRSRAHHATHAVLHLAGSRSCYF